MARYFFHIVNNTGKQEDLVGRELPDRVAARVEAAQAAGDILREELATRDDDIRLTVLIDDGSDDLTVLELSVVRKSINRNDLPMSFHPSDRGEDSAD